MYIPNPTARLGEKEAKEYLKKQGYKIIETNFRKGYGEIDIIAIEKDTLVFIEVKTRSSNRFGTPFEAITNFKLYPLKRTAEFYKKLHPELPARLRIDAVGVIMVDGFVESIQLIKNISQL